MKLLFFVDPSIIMTEIFLELATFRARFRHRRWFLAFGGICKYIVFRIICFVVGLDAFLVKFRETSNNYINKEELTITAFLGSAAFLFQVLAVVNLTFVVRTRLFFFIFGGADCAVSSRDKAKEWLWNAMLARKIRKSHNFVRFLIIMLSFTDFDIQRLLLHVKK